MRRMKAIQRRTKADDNVYAYIFSVNENKQKIAWNR
jgi:hypothetical protein